MVQSEAPAFPHLPARLERLGELAYNLWWSWHADARSLYRTLDYTLWRSTRHNPVQMLNEISPELLQAAAENDAFLSLYHRALERYDHYMSGEDTWYQNQFGENNQHLVAYFCAEFAVHNSLPIYSGGLGLLAGDTCKEASDLGLPFVGIGALYPEGYFKQRMAPDGSQVAIYERLSTKDTPLLQVLNDDGSPLRVAVPVADREIYVGLWTVRVGRVSIYLMDTDIDENEPWDRDLTARLYGGDTLHRLRQEVILGIGGIRALHHLGFEPDIFHLNEGHAAFVAIELLRLQLEQGKSLDEGKKAVRKQLVFTTHTPVKAGHDEFSFAMMEEHFHAVYEQMGLDRESFFKLGSPQGAEHFSMTVLALNLSRQANGVSEKHGEVSRDMWHFLYPERGVEDVPIKSVTNGIHVPTWLAAELVPLLTEHLGAEWWNDHDNPEIWRKVSEIPDDILWQTHSGLREKLVSFARERARAIWRKEGADKRHVVACGALLRPEALTIGFARRFATYKRAGLIFSDPERLKRILLNQWRPVQIIFSGKAHPADEPGKFLLKRIFQASASHGMGGQVAFLEDYDKHVAHHLIQGVDVWLNNPRPPQEASGTSGQKASLNGVINFSVRDGWWYEGYTGSNGWEITGESDEEAAESIYSQLENDIVPRFYDRDSEGIPHQWVALMKEAMISTSAAFSARRMVKEYINEIYEIPRLVKT